ncbi:MAG: succinate dehydrogenase/fumarate reductase iron-sulfur subunit [Dehalococcoidia bacterium]
MPQQTFVIQRYDPVEERSYEQEFSVDYEPGETVLDCINEIKWSQDGTLSYRMSCRHAICGSCAMKVNGKSMLACKTQVMDALRSGDPIRVGPMGNQRVIKDLVVDDEKFMRQFERAETWLQPHEGQEPPQREYRQAKEEFDQWQHTSTCIHCGACYSDCTVAAVDPHFLGPAALAKAYRFVFDSRDGKKEERLEKLSRMPGGIWDCTRCFMCVEACPKDVLPMDAIMALRTEAIKLGVSNNHGSRHSKAFAGGVRKRGRLDEATLPILSAGFRPGALLELMQYTPAAIRLLRSRKLLAAAKRHGASKDGRREIQRIFDEVEEEKRHHDVDRESFLAEQAIALKS